ncbi:HNH endonuclease [Neptuniibacter sp. QD48_11]|uniref:HNH endonuclease n=1 Tax=unclassified Neptuniibacter TaxID=2630693 RepID=UPI0039F450BC
MAVYNTASDSANTAVRAFLTKVGEHYLGHSFNTGSGKGKALWLSIRDEDFRNCCGYCGEKNDKLQIEHVLMFNRAEFGLHHPGNIIPCCKQCNKRERLEDKSYCNWEQHLAKVCDNRGEPDKYEARRQRIIDNFKKHNYPELNSHEKHAIRVIASSLYNNIKTESDKSLDLYKELDKAFLQK